MRKAQIGRIFAKLNKKFALHLHWRAAQVFALFATFALKIFWPWKSHESANKQYGQKFKQGLHLNQ